VPVILIFSTWLVGAPTDAITAELKKETVQAFEQYIRTAEARMEEQLRANRNFLWVEESGERRQQVRQGQIVTQRWTPDEVRVPSGLIHDWIGVAYIPDARLEQTLARVQDYDRHKDSYRPEVIDSKLLSRNGNDFRVHLRLLKKKVLTVVLNTEHEVHYVPLDRTRWRSRSYSTRIAEVRDAGKPGEQELPVGQGHGFLWRLYSYWKFEEKDGGVYVECRAISLTRNVPTGLGWLIEPIIRNLPRESLANTLRATRDAVRK